MTREDIIETTKDFLVTEFEVERETILPEANLKETLDLDSLDYIDLVVVVETNFGFKPTADDFKLVETFNDFYELVENKLG